MNFDFRTIHGFLPVGNVMNCLTHHTVKNPSQPLKHDLDGEGHIPLCQPLAVRATKILLSLLDEDALPRQSENLLFPNRVLKFKPPFSLALPVQTRVRAELGLSRHRDMNIGTV